MRTAGWFVGAVLFGLLGVAAIAVAPARADGAVARGDGGRVGISYNYRDLREAEARAIEECGRYCRIVGTFRHMCAAIATSERGGYGWARADRLGRAEDDAVGYCRREGGHQCRVAARGCDDRR